MSFSEFQIWQRLQFCSLMWLTQRIKKETIRNKLKALLLQKITFDIIYLKFIDFFLSISFSSSFHQFSNKLRGLYYELYSATLYLHQMEAVMFIIPQYFSTCGKIVCEQLTVYGVGGLLFSVLWNDFMNKRYMFLLL